MRKLLFILLFSLLSYLSEATIYYVSSSGGSDSNVGTSTAAPWQTLNKVNTTVFTTGDQILFKAGDTFNGSLTASNSVQGWDKVLTYGTYGTGAKPVISGFQTISSWTNQGNGIYSATLLNSGCNLINFNGVNKEIARYPKTGYLTFETYSGSTSITDNELAASPSWVGAKAVVRVNGFQYYLTTVTAHSNHTLTVSGGSTPGTTGEYKYFLQNHVNALTQVGDWYVSGSTIYMYFGANSPSSYVVKVANTSILFAISKNYVTINGLRFEGANDKGIESVGTNNVVQNCEFEFMGHYAITCAQSNVTVDNNTILNGNGTALYINANGYLVKNNTILNHGLFAGMVTPGTNNYNGIDILASSGGTCEYNVLSNVGYLGISAWGSNNIIRYNKVDGFCSLLPDGGGIYLNYIGTTYPTGIQVYNNFVFNGSGEGLYSDAVNQNTTWHDNLVMNCVSGLLINTPINHTAYNNILYNNTFGFNFYNWHTNSLTPNSCSITSNSVIEGTASTFAAKIGDSTNRDILAMGTVNSNKVYSEASKQAAQFKAYFTPSAPLSNYNISDWRALTGFETTSTVTSITLANVRIEYNDTKTAKNVALGAAYYTQTGESVNAVTLQPFTAMLLIKNTSWTPNVSGQIYVSPGGAPYINANQNPYIK